MRAVEVPMHLTILREYPPRNLLFEFLISHEIVVPSLHLPHPRTPRRIANTKFEDVGISREEFRNDGSLEYH